MSKVAGERQRRGGDGECTSSSNGEKGKILAYHKMPALRKRVQQLEIREYETETLQITLDIGVNIPPRRLDALRSPQSSCRALCNEVFLSIKSRPFQSGHMPFVDTG